MADNGIVGLFIHAESKATPASPLNTTTNGGTFADQYGWYGAPAFDQGTTELITDRSIIGLFIRAESKITPAIPQNITTNGGTFADQHGWYGNLSSQSGDANADRGPVIIVTLFGLLQPFKNYLMQAYESGGGCVGKVRRVWLAVGAVPDLSAAQYTGTRCTPPGTFSDFAILAAW